MNTRSSTYGGLACQEYDLLPEGQAPQLLVVLCHGFGAPGTDLVPLGPELLAQRPELAEAVRFVFPAAPLSLASMGMPGGRAWWMIDVARITETIARGELRQLTGELPEGAAEARDRLRALVAELRQHTGLPAGRIVLGGFSQGAMLATDVALGLEEAPAGLCVFSGTLLCEEAWRTMAAHRGTLPVLQSHGRQDPILPFEAALWLRDMFVEAGLEVDFLPFDGPHTIPREAIDRLASLLSRLTE